MAPILDPFPSLMVNYTPMKLFVWALAVILGCASTGVAGELQDAAARGDINRVRALVKARPADINIRDAGTTALHEATRAGHLEIVKFLVENGANVNATDFSRLTPLKLALGRRQTTIAEFLRGKGGLEQAQPPVVQPVPGRPATSTAPAPAPRALFQTNATPSASTRPPAPRTTTNYPAPTPGNPSAPAQKEKPASQEDMMAVIFPIHEAARVGDVEQIKFLYKNSPDLVDATDQKGLTPLHVAAANRQFGVAQTLVGLRAKVNAKSNGGQTPLHVSVRNGDVSITGLLLTNRAEVDARDNFGNTPLLIALQSADAEALDGGGLASRTPGAAGVALATMKLQQLQLATLLVRHRANVNARNRAGSTPLSQAVRLGNDAVVSLLLASAANPNSAEPGTGKTPLHVASGRGQLGIVQALIRSRAEINAVDARGDTPLCHALREGRTNTISALRAAGGTIGRARALNSHEQNLVAFYQQTEAGLQRASSSEKARILIGLNPTKAECERMFPRHAAAAWKVVEEINRQIKVTFSRPVRDAEQGKDIWRVAPESPGLVVEEWRSRGWLRKELPAYSLAVDKLGATSRPGDYCFVNNRWVLVPPLRTIAAQFAATQPARR